MLKKLVLLCFMFLLILPGCSTPPERGLVVAIPTDPDGFHPLHSVAAASSEIAFNIYEGLVKVGPDGSVLPGLATEWEISSDGLIYSFSLRPNVKFHNGRSLEPRDVVYCLQQLFDPEVTAKASEFSAVEKVWAEGNEVIIALSRPDAAFLAQLTEFGASIYPREAEGLLDKKPVGTGPYVLTQWQPNDSLALTRFEDYWNQELQLLDTVTLQIIPDPNTAVTNLRSGHVNLIPRLEPEYMHHVETDPDLKIIADPMNLVQLLVMNNARPPFDNIKVRQAINYAINREEIIEGAAWGYGTTIGTNMSPAMGDWYNSQVDAVYPFSQAQARLLLTEAGYPDGFAAKLSLPSNYPLHVSAGEIITHQLGQVGINLEIEMVEWATWLEQVYRGRDYDLTVIGFTGKLDPHTVLGRYQSTSSRNMGSFVNQEFDRLLQLGLEVTDIDDRRSVYHEIQMILAQEATAAFLMDPNQIAVMSEDVQGWQNYPVYVLDFSSVSRGK